MKKTLCIMLASLMMVLSACGMNVNVNTQSTAEDVQKPAEEVSETPETSEATEASEVTAKPPVYKLIKKYYSGKYSGKNKTDGDGNSLEDMEIFDGMSEIIMLADESKELYPNLYEKFNDGAKKALQIENENADTMIKDANADADSSADDKRPFMGPWTSYSKMNIVRADSKVVSIIRDFGSFSGGAHGIYGKSGATYDIESGERLKLTDIAEVTQDELIPVLKEKILQTGDPDDFTDLDENLANYSISVNNEIMSDSGEDTTETETGYEWYLGFDGIHFYFGPYEIGPYAIGDRDVVISYEEFPGKVNEKYLPDTDKGYITAANLPMYSSTVDEESDTSLHFVFETQEEEYDDSGYVDCTSLTLRQGDKSAKAEDETFSYNFNSDSCRQYKIVTADKKEYIYAIVLTYSDYSDVIVYDITGGDIKHSGDYICHLAGADLDTEYYGDIIPTDPENMCFADVGDMFGTYTCYGRYVVGANGLPEFAGKDYTVSWNWENDVKSVKDIEATVLDENGNEEGTETIPAGTVFKPVRTDNETFMDFTIDDGRTVRLKYTKSDYPAEINGEKVDDLFEGLMYAG